MDTSNTPETITVTTARVFCDGDERGGDGHPRVWLQLGAGGFADCSYCDRRYVLAAGNGGPSDH